MSLVFVITFISAMFFMCYTISGLNIHHKGGWLDVSFHYLININLRKHEH